MAAMRTPFILTPLLSSRVAGAAEDPWQNPATHSREGDDNNITKDGRKGQ